MTDFLIVGGGSAGCVLAAELARSGAEVVLLEAGPNVDPSNVQPDIADLYPRSSFNGSYFWGGLTADTGAGRTSFLAPRVLGGGSSVNGMASTFGVPADYESWAADGATGWGWNELGPSFERVDEVLPLQRRESADWPPFVAGIGAAAEHRGWSQVADMLTDFRDGYCTYPLAASATSRASAATTFLTSEVRAQPNLTIRCDTRVERLRFQGTRCVGVSAIRGEKRVQYDARHVVLSGGAILSPTLLLRSGIGAPRDLEPLGIDVVAPLSGVGDNLQNHPIMYLATYLRRESRQDEQVRQALFSILRYSSDRTDARRQSDMALLVISRTSFQGVGAATAALGVCLYGPDSRGKLRLTSADPEVYPDIRFEMLSDPNDVRRMADGVELARDLMNDEAVRRLRHELFIAGTSSLVRRLNGSGVTDALLSKSIRVALDGSGPLRQQLIRHGVARGAGERQLRDRSWLETAVRERAVASYHPAGTCRMGSADDSRSVIGPDTCVHGVEGVSVVDNSVMPTIVRGNTNLPAMMIGMRAASILAARN